MSFKLGKKILIVNNVDQAQLLFFAKLASGVTRLVETDDDFQTTNPFDDLVASPDTQSGAEGAGFLPATPANTELIAQADFLRILGFADLVGSEISSVIGAKGVPGVKQEGTVTFVISSVVVGQEISIELEFKSDNNEGEFASHLSDYKRKKVFTIVVRSGETATTLANRLVSDINSIAESGWAEWITASNVAGVVTLVSTNAGVQFLSKSSGSAIDAGNATAAFAVTVDGYGGRNTYDQLKGLRLDTVGGHYPQTHLADQVPLKGAKYSSYLIKKNVSRPDLAGNAHINDVPSGSFEFQIFVNETLTGYIADLTKWLNANVASRGMYASTSASAVLGGDPLTSETVVDSSAPFTTPLI